MKHKIWARVDAVLALSDQLSVVVFFFSAVASRKLHSYILEHLEDLGTFMLLSSTKWSYSLLFCSLQYFAHSSKFQVNITWFLDSWILGSWKLGISLDLLNGLLFVGLCCEYSSKKVFSSLIIWNLNAFT